MILVCLSRVSMPRHFSIHFNWQIDNKIKNQRPIRSFVNCDVICSHDVNRRCLTPNIVWNKSISDTGHLSYTAGCTRQHVTGKITCTVSTLSPVCVTILVCYFIGRFTNTLKNGRKIWRRRRRKIISLFSVQFNHSFILPDHTILRRKWDVVFIRRGIYECRITWLFSFLYARLKNGTYYAVAMSVRPSVRLSVCPSVRPSVRVFRTFLQHALRYQFETWYIHSVGGTTCRVWVASQLGHFDLVYSQK